MPYLNVVEVESALTALAGAHPATCELITLPNLTVEGRTTHALRIGTQPSGSVPTYYMTGGVHAREWGSCEILVNLATDLLDAYAGGTTLAYGNKGFSAAEVRALVERTNVIVFPCVNPDGRYYSQTMDGLWRKNRNPADSAGDPSKVGIDINRNQDFLWDFRTAFNPAAINIFLASDSPGDDTYHGHAPASEQETKNVNHIHDHYGPVAWYVDLHSYSEDILYVWGDDEAQTSDPNQTFVNSAFNHIRGVIGDTYAEYIPDADHEAATTLARTFTTALAEVRGKSYVAKPSFSLYPTAGTNDDYAYSRHIADPGKPKTIGFTVEWGTEFQPPWTEMEQIIGDVCAGLIGLGLQALGTDSFIVSNRDTFSSYEVESHADYPASFYLIYDGFSPTMLGGPPVVDVIDTTAATIGSIAAVVSPPQLEQPGNPNAVQRVTYTVDLHFSDGSAFTAETREVLLRARLSGLQDIAPLQLVRQPNPYMLDGPISWLSTDLRVFQLRPHQGLAASAATLGDPAADPDAALHYIQALVAELRAHGNNTAQAFEQLSGDENASRLELSRSVGGERVMNFALAKVRYRANSQDANNVRVFFRMFNAMVSDLSYNISTGSQVQNYRRTTAGDVALLGFNEFFSGAGSQITSIPFFASRRVDTSTTSMTQQPDPTNAMTMQHAVGTETLAYFGCWLDFNQTDPQFPTAYPGNDGPYSSRIPIPQLVRGLHQCLVAEVRFQPGATDPIPMGATPGSSDRLSQRNLAIVESDNPGVDDTHRVQHTLLIKPSQTAGKVATGEMARITATTMPDELVLRFGDLPPSTVVSLYFPDFTADEILTIAGTRPGPSRLARVDAHTVSAHADALLYVPIPGRSLPGAPGLLTLQLPQTVQTGQLFRIDVEQHSGQTYAARTFTRDRKSPDPGLSTTLSRRKVLGAFRMTTLVREGPALLARAVQDLATLKYVRTGIPAADSWAQVFDRCIGQQSAQVAGLGGDPAAVPASLDYPPGPLHGPADRLCRRGKVHQVTYDCHGNFRGFTLRDCDNEWHFASREPAIAELVLRACKDRLDLTICVAAEDGRILEVRVDCGC